MTCKENQGVTKKLEEVDKLETREKELNDYEAELATKSNAIARDKILVAEEKKILRDKKLQLDKLKQERQAKLKKLNKMLGE